MSVYCHPTIRLLPVNKLPKTLVTQQGVETARGNLRLHDAETQPKVGWGKFGSRMPLVKTGVVTSHLCPHIKSVRFVHERWGRIKKSR